MKCAVDLDGTITSDPEFYRGELKGLMSRGHQVHVLSGNPMAEHKLAQLGFVKGRDFTVCSQVPLKHIAAAKVAYMQQAGITHLIDNRHKNCVAARRAGITAHHHMKPKTRREVEVMQEPLAEVMRANEARIRHLAMNGIQFPRDLMYVISLLEFLLLEDIDAARSYHERRIAPLLDKSIAGLQHLQAEAQSVQACKTLLDGVR